MIEEFRGADAQEIKVALVTLDDFARHRQDKIDLLKIDVEGAELGVLQGAREMIAAHRIQVLQIEMTENNLLSRTFFRGIAQPPGSPPLPHPPEWRSLGPIRKAPARRRDIWLSKSGSTSALTLRRWRCEIVPGSSDRRPARV